MEIVRLTHKGWAPHPNRHPGFEPGDRISPTESNRAPISSHGWRLRLKPRPRHPQSVSWPFESPCVKVEGPEVIPAWFVVTVPDLTATITQRANPFGYCFGPSPLGIPSGLHTKYIRRCFAMRGGAGLMRKPEPPLLSRGGQKSASPWTVQQINGRASILLLPAMGCKAPSID